MNSKYDIVTNDNWSYGIYNQIDASGNDGTYTAATKDTIKLSSPIDFVHTTTHTAAQAYEKVVKYAGCCINRDWLDALMASDTQNGVATYTGGSGKFTGDNTNRPGIIDSQYDNKPADASADWSPWPTLNSTTAPADTDGDGMPDTWETSNGLNPNDASDGNTAGSDGYTNLENYLNSIVADITTNELEGGTVMGSETEGDYQTSTHELSQATNSTNTTSEYTFDNGFSITNANNKAYATGTNNCIKFSAGLQYTIVIPSNLAVTAIEIVGYDNYTDLDAYLGELGGVTYAETQYVFPKDKSVKDYTITFANPVTGKLTFTPKIKQVVWKFIITATTTTGIKKIYTVDASAKNIYSTDGRLIRKNATENDIKSLPKGAYIIGNKTRLVK